MLVVIATLAGAPASAGGISADSLRAWIAAGRTVAADSASLAQMESAERRFGPSSREATVALNLRVETLFRLGQGAQPNVRDLAARAIAQSQRLFGRDSIDIIPAWRNQAYLLLQAGEFTAARDTLQRVLSLERRASPADSITIADTEVVLAGVLNTIGDDEAARALDEDALGIFERSLPAEDPRFGDCLTGLANVLTDLGAYDMALATFRRAVRQYEAALGPRHATVAVVLANMARLQQRIGDYSGARAGFQRAAAIQYEESRAHASSVLNTRRLAFTLTFLGETLESIGDYEAARDTLVHAWRIREGALGPTHPLLAATLIQLADVYKDLEDYAHARANYERALSILRDKSGAEDPNYAVALQSLAGVLTAQGQHAEAESLSAQALATLEAAYGARHHMVAKGLAVEANIRLQARDLPGAEAALRRALAIEADVLSADHPDATSARALLARVLFLRGDSRGALEAALEAEENAREHLRVTERSLSEREALAYAATRSAGLAIALTVAEEGLPDSLLRRICDTVIRSRAVVLDEMAARHRLPALRSDSTAARLSAAVAAAAQRYANLAVRGPDDEHPERFRALIAAARREKESAERELAASPALVRGSVAPDAGLDEVSAALPPSSRLVGFVRYDRLDRSDADRPAFGAFLVGSGGTATFVPLGSARDIETSVADWRREAGVGILGRSARAAEAAYRRAGARLRRLIWDPLRAPLAGAERVFIVPDETLNFVSLGTLPSAHGQYVVEGHTLLHYLSAERDLADRPSTAKSDRLVAFGGLDFDRAARRAQGARPVAAAYRGEVSECGSLRSIRFEPLPGTLREVEEIAAVWRRAYPERAINASTEGRSHALSLFLGTKGTEAEFKQNAGDAGILHLATHGFFLDSGCAPAPPRGRGIGGLEPLRPVPAPERPRPTPAPRASKNSAAPAGGPRENPLLLAGLVLAGANQPLAGAGGEDGILTAEEIAAMDLSRVRLAVLSACATGLGRATTGEGILGLRRAFQTAGASTLIMSLWPTEDDASERWMRALYRGLVTLRRETAQAARDASRDELRRRRAAGQSTHPFYWGAFVAAGDWR